jgi:ligand-binding SRPBCC domain-containing protein
VTFGFSLSSELDEPIESVWSFVSTMRGVNYELAPLARMTYPKTVEALTTIAVGQRVFRSVVLFLGFIPFDLHDLTFVRLEPGKGFSEKSPSLMQHYWIHERTLEPSGQGCIVRDRIEFMPRLPLVGHVMLPIFRLVFQNRHRKLRQKFGEQML